MEKFNTPVKSLAFSIAFIWIGFICSISFMEAWLKFQAEGVTLPVGLSIGRLIFQALNRVEWAFAAVLFASLIKNRISLLFYVTVLLLAIQTLFILPSLNSRVDLILQGEILPASSLHFYYLGMEAIKVICLLRCGLKLMRDIPSKSLHTEDSPVGDFPSRTIDPQHIGAHAQ